MTTTQGPGRGRTIVIAACALLVAVGVALTFWALNNQTGEPPTPDQALSRSASGGGAGSAPTSDAPDAAPSEPATSGPEEPAPEDAAPETEAPPSAAPTTEEEAEPEVSALPRSEPVQIDIASIDVTSPMHALGLLEDGTIDVPSGERYDEAAWYDGSVTPGEAGVSVIEGHVTSQGSTPSIFFELGAMEPGDQVDVTRADGTVATFEVTALDTFPKDDFPTGRVFGNSDTPELVLITCGGEYDAEERAHADNIVVYASLVA